MSRRLLVVGGLVMVGVGAMVAPGRTPPLYDGVGFPDEPYRYVVAPPGYQHTKPPTSGVNSGAAAQGHNTSILYANSAEQGPQVSVYVPAGALAVPAGARTVTLRADPEAPSPEPPDGSVVGNVYRVSASTPAGPGRLTGTAGSTGIVEMRAPTARQPGPQMQLRVGGVWRHLTTNRVGNDIYQSPLPALGDYALVQLTHPPAAAAHGGGGGGATVGIVVGCVVAGLVVLFGGIRLSRRRSAAAPG